MDFEDPKLKNILKLKEAFEKELVKMGKLKPKPKTSSSKPSVKLNIDIAPAATVSATDTWTVLDLNRQDYDATDASIIKALRQSLGKVGDIRQRTIVDGIIKLLQGDYESAKDVFSRFDGDEFRYMLGVTKLYSGDPDTLSYAVKFLKERSTVFYPYLLMSEIMMGLGRYSDAEKFFEAAAKISKDIYLYLVLGVYREEPSARKLFPIAVNKRGYKSLLAIISIFIEKNLEKAKKIAESLSKRENSCCRYIASFWGNSFRSEDSQKFGFCPRITLMKWAKDFEEDRLEGDPRKASKWNDPFSDLFSALYSFDIGEYNSADEYFRKFESSVKIKKRYLYRSGKMVKKHGMTMFYEPMDPEPLVEISVLSSSEIRKTMDRVSKEMKLGKEHIDIYVDFRDPEILKLFFGQRHCSHLYGD